MTVLFIVLALSLSLSLPPSLLSLSVTVTKQPLPYPIVIVKSQVVADWDMCLFGANLPCAVNLPRLQYLQQICPLARCKSAQTQLGPRLKKRVIARCPGAPGKGQWSLNRC